MGSIKPDQFMVTFNETVGVVYAARKGRLKTTTPEHAKALKECLEQYFEGERLTDEEM